MTLYFAYGSNMDGAAMRCRCPGAQARGTAVLADHRFFIGPEGWGSIRPARGNRVHGVLWRLTPRDLAALHAYEWLHKGLYDVRTAPVRVGARHVAAMIYRLRRQAVGWRGRAMSRDRCRRARLAFPAHYIDMLERMGT